MNNLLHAVMTGINRLSDLGFFTTHLMTLLLINLIGSFIFVLLIYLFLRNKVNSNEYIFYLFPLLLSIFIPFFGIIISSCIVIILMLSHSRYFHYIETIDDSINLKDIKYTYQNYGAGGALLRLMKPSESPETRTNALFVLAQGQLAGLNPTLRALLPDTSDEIRLLSFQILDQQEGLIQKDINKILTILNKREHSPTWRAQFEKNLALLYWELSYRHLILKELEDITLKNSLSYALSALKVLKNDSTIFSILGKIYLRLQQYELAKEYFIKANEYNVSAMHVLPYLAEINFKLKKYSSVKKYLNQSDALLDSATVFPVKKYWDKK